MLECKTTVVGEEASVSLIGKIDENSRDVFGNLHGKLAGTKRVTIDFAEVSLINSLGIRIWLNFLWGFQDGRELLFKNVCPAMLNQLRVVKGFAGNAKILSFQTYFNCPNCNEDVLYDFDIAWGKEKALQELDKVFCPKCKQPMDSEEDPETIGFFYESAAG